MSLGPNQNAVVRAAIYTRISSDPSGQRAGVERQRVDCEALCVARGWEVAEVFEDYADARVMPTLAARALAHWGRARRLSA